MNKITVQYIKEDLKKDLEEGLKKDKYVDNERIEILNNIEDVIINNDKARYILNGGRNSKITNLNSCCDIEDLSDNTAIYNSGDHCGIRNYGDNSQIVNFGERSTIRIWGDNCCVLNFDKLSKISGRKGTYILYAKDGNIKDTKIVQIGNENYKDYKGEILKEDVEYILYNDEIYPVSKYMCKDIVILSEKNLYIEDLDKYINICEIINLNMSEKNFISKGFLVIDKKYKDEFIFETSICNLIKKINEIDNVELNKKE